MNIKDNHYYFALFKQFCQAILLCAGAIFLFFLLLAHHNGIEPWATITQHILTCIAILFLLVCIITVISRYIGIKKYEKACAQKEERLLQERQEKQIALRNANAQRKAQNDAKMARKKYVDSMFNELNKDVHTNA